MMEMKTIKGGIIAKVLIVGKYPDQKQLSILLEPWVRLGSYDVTLTYNTHIGLACHTERFKTWAKQQRFFDELTLIWFQAELNK